MKINSNNLCGSLDSSFYVNLLSECMKLYNSGDRLIYTISDYLKEDNFDADAGYEVLSILEDFLDFELPYLNLFFEGRASGYPDLNRRLKDILINLDNIKFVVEPLLDEFVPLTLSEAEGVKTYLMHAIGHLCIFIKRQFELTDYINEDVLEFSLEVYMSDNNLVKEDIEKLYIQLTARSIAYRPKVAVFEEYPNLEQPFFDKVGDEFYDLEFINPALVIDVINDKITPEELLTLINENR